MKMRSLNIACAAIGIAGMLTVAVAASMPPESDTQPVTAPVQATVPPEVTGPDVHPAQPPVIATPLPVPHGPVMPPKGDTGPVTAPSFPEPVIPPSLTKPEPVELPTLSIPPCAQEDSLNCYWEAAIIGNGTGTSFINWNGVTYYAATEGN